MASLRTPETEEKYRQYREAGNLNNGCKLCGETSLEDFIFWRVIINNFPYDKVFRIHHMLIPKRCVKEQDLSGEEKTELMQIKSGFANDNYDYMLEPTEKGKTIPNHMHIHLLVAKE